MQNKYVGDIGDYGKYGLLRALCGYREDCSGEKLSLGIVWYLNPDDKGPGGGHTEYLHKPERFRSCDPPVFHTLYWIVEAKQRNVASSGDSEIFPSGSVFFDDLLILDGQPVDRRRWANSALDATKGCDLVFVDPDNGLEPSSGPTPKHVTYDELSPYVTRGQTLVIYHHLARQNHVQQVKDRARDLKRKPARPDVRALLFHPYAPRAYFIVPGRHNMAQLNDRIHTFLKGPWGQHRSGQKHPHFERIV